MPRAPLLPLVAVLVFALGAAAVLVVSPATVQEWCRRQFERYPEARAFTFAFDYELMTNPRHAWILRALGVVWLSFAAFIARAVTGAVA